MSNDRGADRRVRRTRRLLHGALASLIHEKPIDAIGVKEILARADVGRSTFYAHFRDKAALLASAIRDTLPGPDGAVGAPADPVERVLRFSLPLLEHVARVESQRAEEADRRARTALRRPRAHAALHTRVRPVLVEWVATELETLVARRASPLRVPADLLAAHVADTFLRVLEWWALGAERRSARELNDIFRSLAGPAVTAAVAAGTEPGGARAS